MLGEPGRLIGDPVAGDAIEGIDGIFDADFLALFISPSVVVNGEFGKACFAPRQLGCDFWFETKAILLDVDPAEGIATKSLVAGFHVGELQSRK